MEYLCNAGRYVISDFKVLVFSNLLQLVGLNNMGVIHWPMFQVKFVPLSRKDGTSSMQSFDCAGPTSMIERLIVFLLSDHNFWLQRCSLLIFCIALRDLTKILGKES